MPNVLHHLIDRGIEKREIFISENDFDNFIERLAEDAEQELKYSGAVRARQECQSVIASG